MWNTSTNKSKDRTKVNRNSKGKRISEIISSNSGKKIRAGKECIKDYRSVKKYGYNTENSHREVKTKAVSPKSSYIKSGIYSSFDINTF